MTSQTYLFGTTASAHHWCLLFASPGAMRAVLYSNVSPVWRAVSFMGNKKRDADWDSFKNRRVQRFRGWFFLSFNLNRVCWLQFHVFHQYLRPVNNVQVVRSRLLKYQRSQQPTYWVLALVRFCLLKVFFDQDSFLWCRCWSPCSTVNLNGPWWQLWQML